MGLYWGVCLWDFFKQVDDLSQLEDPSFLRFEFIFACVFLALLALRLWVMRGQGSALPAEAPVWNRVAAKIGYASYLQLWDDEKLESYFTGDAGGWDIASHGSVIAF